MEMNSEKIKAIRHSLGESTSQFAERFARSARTIEDWEQARYEPDALILRMLSDLQTKQDKKSKKQ